MHTLPTPSALDILLAAHDGPVTPYVVMARAIRLARAAGPVAGAQDDLVDALDEALRAVGVDTSDDVDHGRNTADGDW